ncbi:hypothetical protein [Kitasatospora sp. NPDC085879]|uniref:helix-turn-helix domain-containing protein n=1 Tax=Kitasatospora sp. NPDC085879 TaxID=3154769 RepID=UPI0034404B14
MNITAVRDISLAINAGHRFIYLVPESARQAAELGVTDRAPAYFAFRSAPMGAVAWQVTLATFYNFSPGRCDRWQAYGTPRRPSGGRPPATRPPSTRYGAPGWA